MRPILRCMLSLATIILLMSSVIWLTRQESASPILWALMVDSNDGFNTEQLSVSMYSPDADIKRDLFEATREEQITIARRFFTWTPNAEWLWYGVRDGRELFLERIKPFGGGSQRLDIHDGFSAIDSMRWSPDGEWGVFVQEDEIGNRYPYRIRPDGSGLSQITDEIALSPNLNILWSANSQHVLFVSGTGLPRTHIFSIDRQDWQLQLVTILDGQLITSQVSLDDTQVAVIVADEPGTHDLYTIQIDGTEVVQHTDAGAILRDLIWVDDDILMSFVPYYRAFPALTAKINVDRNVVLYQSNHGLPSTQQVIWSNDWQYLMSVSRTFDGSQPELLFTMQADRSQQIALNITLGCTNLTNPFWSPDGQWIFYWDQYGSACRLFRAKRDGTNSMVLEAINEEVRPIPILTPSHSEWIMFEDYNTPYQIHQRLLDAATGEFIPLPEHHEVVGWVEMQIEHQPYFISLIFGCSLFALSGFYLYKSSR